MCRSRRNIMVLVAVLFSTPKATFRWRFAHLAPTQPAPHWFVLFSCFFLLLLPLCFVSLHLVFLLLVPLYPAFAILSVSSPSLFSCCLFFLFYSLFFALFPFFCFFSFCPFVLKPLHFITFGPEIFSLMRSPCCRLGSADFRPAHNSQDIPSGELT